MPFVKWLRAEERPLESRLRITRLAHVGWDQPEFPIPLISALNFVAEISAREAVPDLGCRVMTEESIGDLGVLGSAAMEGPTVRAGLMRAGRTMPAYCTHERFVFRKTPGGGRLLVSFDVAIRADALHIAHQYTAALVRLYCLGAGGTEPVFNSIAIPPHPICGVAHLQPWFGNGLTAATGRILAIDLSNAVLDLKVRRPTETLAAPTEVGRPPLSDAGGIEPMIRYLIGSMLAEGVPTARALALSSGMSLRSLQRALSLAGTSFSAVLDSARREQALECFASDRCPLDELAAELGYSDTACLTRAVRRWTGSTPGQLRRRGGAQE